MRLVHAGTHPPRNRRGQSLGVTNNLAAHGHVGERDPLSGQKRVLFQAFLQGSRRGRQIAGLTTTATAQQPRDRKG